VFALEKAAYIYAWIRWMMTNYAFDIWLDAWRVGRVPDQLAASPPAFLSFPSSRDAPGRRRFTSPTASATRCLAGVSPALLFRGHARVGG